MNWLRLSASIFVFLIIITIAFYILLSPEKPDSADPAVIIERLEESEAMFENLQYQNITTVGDRILVQAEFVGDPATLKQEADWHQLAQNTANELYTNIVKNRSIEVQIYQGNNLRAVAVAGI
ncbi:MAG: hypothetical protein GX208_04775 [Firmicutes bacterium]|nr:hypothetical protein [Bacillota bacterium]